jgi:hypothetical protein
MVPPPRGVGRFVAITAVLRRWLEPLAVGKAGPVMPVKSKALFK